MSMKPSWGPPPQGRVTLTFDVYSEHVLGPDDLRAVEEAAAAELDAKVFDIDRENCTIEIQLGS